MMKNDLEKEKFWKNFEFEETLEIIGITRGRSAANFEAKSKKGKDYYIIFMTDLLDMLKNGDVKKNGVISGTFIVKKRGRNFGIRLKSTPSRRRDPVDWRDQNYPIPQYI